jgi:hypothetical protein
VGESQAAHVQARFGVSGAERRRLDRHDSWNRRRRAVVETLAPGTLARRDGPISAPPTPPFAEPPEHLLQPVGGVFDGWNPAIWYRPWWPQMPAFVLPSFADAHVRLNVVGREASGVVLPEEYARACDDVERFLRACLSGRTRRPVVADVWRPRAADPFDPDAPDADLVVSFAADADALEHPEVGSVGPLPVPRTGGHSNRGFALFVGPGIRSGEVRDGRLVDLPATLLTLADATPTRPMDGTSLVRRDRVAAG